MRVLLVSGSYPPMKCGVGDYTLQLTHALATLGRIQVGVLTSVGADSSAGDVEVMPEVVDWTAHQAACAGRAIRAWKPDIVHIQYPTQGYGNGRLPTFLPLIALASGTRVVQTWHEPTSLRGAASFLLRAVVPGPTVVVRPGFEKSLHPALRAMLIGRKLHFIPNASAIPRSALDASQCRVLRQQYLGGQARLVVFFGFIYPFKGVDMLFDVADPATDHIVIAGEGDASTDYVQSLHRRAEAAPWAGHVTFTGFLSPTDAADLLAVADAVVLPFRRGGGDWNTSIHGATVNDAYVITTSERRLGFDSQVRVHYTPIDDVRAMRLALSLAGERQADHRWGEGTRPAEDDPWKTIAIEHRRVYEAALGRKDVAPESP